MPWAFLHHNHFLYTVCQIINEYVFVKRKGTLTTVSKPACRRFLQLIHIKGAAVLHFNVVFPPTTFVWPMIANFTSHFTVSNSRMLSFDPSWGMRATTTHRWAWSGHLWVTSNTSKAIPARGDISLITSNWVLSSERLEAVGCIEVPVVAAWVIRCNCSKKKRCKRNLKHFRCAEFHVPVYYLTNVKGKNHIR